MYRDVNGELKGDGLCCYLKKESVELALTLLDQSDFNGSTISVQRVNGVAPNVHLLTFVVGQVPTEGILQP